MNRSEALLESSHPVLSGRALAPRSGPRGERPAAVEVLAQLNAAVRRPALALPQARDQVPHSGQPLAVFIACVKLLAEASNSARQAAAGGQATGVRVSAQVLSPAIRQRLLSDVTRKLRASCASDSSGQVSLSLAAGGPGTTIPSLFGSHLRLGLARPDE